MELLHIEIKKNGVLSMAKTSEAQLRAVKKYDKKSKVITLKYTDNQNKDYYRVKQYCNENNIPLQKYIKKLIDNDLDSKGITYPSDMDMD